MPVEFTGLPWGFVLGGTELKYWISELKSSTRSEVKPAAPEIKFRSLEPQHEADNLPCMCAYNKYL